ncbi:MAG TPA: hypothetical protein VGA40_08755 [Candidatus Acidoferrales bacterium]
MTEPSLREEILSGKARRERKMAACGGAGLSPEERVEVLAFLSLDSEEAIAQRAASALLTQPAEAFRAAAARPDVHEHLLQYCSENLADKPGMADTLAGNPRTPADTLARMVPYFSVSTVQALMNDPGRLSDSDVLVAALAGSSLITVEQKHMLEALQKLGADESAMAAVVDEAEPDAHKRMTLLQRLSKMRVVERIKVGLTGNREERMVLIREPNKLVQRAVLSSPKLTENEVESFAAMANLSDETLRMIAANRQHIKNYTIVKNLMNNPKTPLDVSMHMMPRLTPPDLKALSTNKNIPETLRTMAAKLVRQRNATRSGG